MEDSKPVTDVTKEAADAELAKLKIENEKFKNEIKDIAGKRDEFKSKLKAIEDGQKMADGKKDELLTEKDKELNDLKTELATVKAKADEFDTYKQTKRDGLLAEIKDEDLKTVANEIQGLDSLEKFVKKINGEKPPDIDNGNAGKAVSLSEEQKAEAAELGMTDDMYIEVMIPRNEKLKNKKKD